MFESSDKLNPPLQKMASHITGYVARNVLNAFYIIVSAIDPYWGAPTFTNDVVHGHTENASKVKEMELSYECYHLLGCNEMIKIRLFFIM